jgi:hypothetical protein
MQPSTKNEGASNNSHSSPVLPKRLAPEKIKAEFKRWREEQPDGYIPTAREDVDHMKELGVSRDIVRDLRRKFPRLKRGQKSSRRETGK